ISSKRPRLMSLKRIIRVRGSRTCSDVARFARSDISPLIVNLHIWGRLRIVFEFYTACVAGQRVEGVIILASFAGGVRCRCDGCRGERLRVPFWALLGLDASFRVLDYGLLAV